MDGVRIGALAAASGTTTKTIRFYEQVGLLPGPPRTQGGYRDYHPGSVERLAFIRTSKPPDSPSPRSAES